MTVDQTKGERLLTEEELETRREMAEREAARKAAHSKAVAKWSRKNVKTKTIGFDMRKDRDLFLYRHIVNQENATAYLKELVERDIEQNGYLHERQEHFGPYAESKQKKRPY